MLAFRGVSAFLQLVVILEASDTIDTLRNVSRKSVVAAKKRGQIRHLAPN